jgi:hypothetical protein
MVGAAWPWIQPHLGSPLPWWLNPMAEKCLQKLHPSQPHLPQLLKGLVHGLKVVEVLPSHSIAPRMQGNRAATGKHREQSGSAIPQVKPLLLPPLH